MKTLRQAYLIAAKDLRSELRTKESLNSTLSFSVVILLLISFAIDPGNDVMNEMAGGLLRLSATFGYANIAAMFYEATLPICLAAS